MEKESKGEHHRKQKYASIPHIQTTIRCTLTGKVQADYDRAVALKILLIKGHEIECAERCVGLKRKRTEVEGLATLLPCCQ